MNGLRECQGVPLIEKGFQWVTVPGETRRLSRAGHLELRFGRPLRFAALENSRLGWGQTAAELELAVARLAALVPRAPIVRSAAATTGLALRRMVRRHAY